MLFCVHLFSCKFLDVRDRGKSIADQRADIRANNQLRGVKLITVFSRLLDEAFHEVSEKIEMVELCVQYTEDQYIGLLKQADLLLNVIKPGINNSLSDSSLDASFKSK